MTKRVAIILSIVLMFLFPVQVLAVGANPEEIDGSLQEAVERIQKDLPQAEIRIVGNVIHIVVDDISDVIWFNNSSRIELNRSTAYSSIGGSFRYYNAPFYATYIPYIHSYMNENVVEALKIQLSEPNIYAWILSAAAEGLTDAAIAIMVESVWGITIPVQVISIITTLLFYAASNLEYWSLVSAQNNSTTGKVSVVKGMSIDGYSSFIYSPWNDNTCTSYAGYDASWYEGVYDIIN